MTKRFFAVLLVISGLLLSAFGITSAQDEMAHTPTVVLSNIWARPAAVGEVSAVYLMIENRSDADLRLVSVSSPVSETVEIHETSMQDNVMRMSPLEDGLEIAAGEATALEPGGLHIMMLDLLEDLEEGGALQLTLTFEGMDEPVEIVTAAVVSLEPLENPAQFIVESTWARPTALETMDEMGGMDHSDMNMGEATEEAEDSMGDMDMTSMIPPSAAYMLITNIGDEDDALIAASSDLIPVVEVHTMTMENDVMRMREVESIPLAAGETIVLEPGGFHIMLMDLQSDLIPGDAVPLTLVFESGAELRIAVPVRDEMEMMMMDMDEG
ncbi:MAG: hypothetical protein OHK0046_27020 [Anaerolineae bacterium]